VVALRVVVSDPEVGEIVAELETPCDDEDDIERVIVRL
jgi:hypothetical protein